MWASLDDIIIKQRLHNRATKQKQNNKSYLGSVKLEAKAEAKAKAAVQRLSTCKNSVQSSVRVYQMVHAELTLSSAALHLA